MPDPVHVADSATGIALARCVRADSVRPALFRTERLLAGVLPDSFTVRGSGYYIKGERCVLVLTRPPACLSSAPARFHRYVQDFDGISVPQITGEFPSAGTLPLDDERLVRAAAALWEASKRPPGELRARVRLWLAFGDFPFAPSPGTEALLRHPELFDQAIERLLLARVRGEKSWWGRERAARALGMHPGSTLRAASRALRIGDFNDRYAAVLLVARDTLPETRAWLVSVLRDSSDLVAEAAIGALQPESRPMERSALIAFALETEAAVHTLTGTVSKGARELPDSIGALIVDSNYLRVVALRRLGSDTSTVVRAAIGRILREPSYSFFYPRDTGHDEDNESGDIGEQTLDAETLAGQWTSLELMAALSDPSAHIRQLAYGEAGRRRNWSAGRMILKHLEAGRLPDGHVPDINEINEMIRALGAVGNPLALPELIRRADLPHAFEQYHGEERAWIRFTAYEQMGNFNDPRALQVLRTLASFTAQDSIWIRWRWDLLWGVPKALRSYGDSTDTAFYKRMAKLSRDQLGTAVGGIASVAGPTALFEFLDEISGQDARGLQGIRLGPWVTSRCGSGR